MINMFGSVESGAVQKRVHFVGLGECCRMSSCFRKFSFGTAENELSELCYRPYGLFLCSLQEIAAQVLAPRGARGRGQACSLPRANAAVADPPAVGRGVLHGHRAAARARGRHPKKALTLN